MEKISISLPDELIQRIHDRLEYGDNRSEWIREAIELRLAIETIEDEGLTLDQLIEDAKDTGEGNPNHPTTAD